MLHYNTLRISLGEVMLGHFVDNFNWKRNLNRMSGLINIHYRYIPSSSRFHSCEFRSWDDHLFDWCNMRFGHAQGTPSSHCSMNEYMNTVHIHQHSRLEYGADSPKSTGLKHLLVFRSFWCCKSTLHRSHDTIKLSGNGQSQSIQFLHICCRICFPFRITGEMSARTKYCQYPTYCCYAFIQKNK